MKLSVGGKELEAELGVETLVVYEEEFGRDLLQDMFGKVDVDVSKLTAEAGDADEGDEPEETEVGSVISVDFTQTNWTAITRVLWASLKTANPWFPTYREWSKSVGGLNLQEVVNELTPVAIRQFFR